MKGPITILQSKMGEGWGWRGVYSVGVWSFINFPKRKERKTRDVFVRNTMPPTAPL